MSYIALHHMLYRRFYCAIPNRQLMVMDETYVMNQCKEDVCYVSTHFHADMKASRYVLIPKKSVVEYVCLCLFTFTFTFSFFR